MENEQVFTDKDIIINEYGVFMNDDALERFKNSQEYQNIKMEVIDDLIKFQHYFQSDIEFEERAKSYLVTDLLKKYNELQGTINDSFLSSIRTGDQSIALQTQLSDLEKQIRDIYKEIIVSNDIKQEDIVAELKKREGTERAVSFDIHSEIKIIDNEVKPLSVDRIRASAGYKSFKESIEKGIKSKEINRNSLPDEIKKYNDLISKELYSNNPNAYNAGLHYIRRLVYKDIYKGIELKRGRPLARFTRRVADAIDKVKGKGEEIAENNRSERKKYRAEEKQAEQRRKAEEQQRKAEAKQDAQKRKEEQKKKEQQRKAKEKQAEQQRKEQAKQDAQERKEEQKQEEQKRKKRNKSLAELEKQERQLEKQQDKVKKDREKITEQITTISKDIEDYFIKSKIADLEDSIKEESKNPRQVYVSDGIKEKIAKELGDETTTKLETLLRERRRLKEEIDNLDTQLEGIRDQKYKMRNLIDGGLSY